jgi:alpha/beta superfamily hydrolase
MEEKITFTSQGHCLECKFTFNARTQGAIVTPPHPLYGGDVDNPVVGYSFFSKTQKIAKVISFRCR